MKSRLDKNSWLFTQPIAHRGLHGGLVPENTIPAYKAAINSGYPIEMDVQMSNDGILYCFHDDNMERLTGVRLDIRTVNSREIDTITVKSEKIPTFKEFLELVDGQVPLLIEIKPPIQRGVEKRVLEALEGYKGEYVLQSFDPRVMLKIKRLDKSVIRGQLGTGAHPGKNLEGFMVRNLALNFLVRPDFVNYDINTLPCKKSVNNGLPIITWTIRTEEDLRKARSLGCNVIFENIRP